MSDDDNDASCSVIGTYNMNVFVMRSDASHLTLVNIQKTNWANLFKRDSSLITAQSNVKRKSHRLYRNREKLVCCVSVHRMLHKQRMSVEWTFFL